MGGKFSGECSLDLGFRFVYSSAPVTLGFGRRLHSGVGSARHWRRMRRRQGGVYSRVRHQLLLGHQHRRHPASKRSERETVQTFKKNKTVFFREEEVLNLLRVGDVKVQLAEKNKIRICVLYGSLIQTETGGAPPPSPSQSLLVQRGLSVKVEGAGSDKAVFGSSAGRQGFKIRGGGGRG